MEQHYKDLIERIDSLDDYDKYEMVISYLEQIGSDDVVVTMSELEEITPPWSLQEIVEHLYDFDFDAQYVMVHDDIWEGVEIDDIVQYYFDDIIAEYEAGNLTFDNADINEAMKGGE